MSDALWQAAQKAADALMVLPIPAVVKAAAGLGVGLATGVEQRRQQARAARVADLKRYGIPLQGDPFDWRNSAALERAQKVEASNAWLADQAAMRKRWDEEDAANASRGRGWKVVRGSVATDETLVRDVPRVEEAPNIIGPTGIGMGGP